MKKGRFKNLFGNMALFTIGNFVSKILVMLLVPFYTNVLTTAEYGLADGMQATLLLLVPLVTINIGEAALRYGIERQTQRKNILKILIKYVGIADVLVMGVCVILYFAFAKAGINPVYFLLFAGLFICNSIYESMILFCQGCEKVKIMITGSIACTFLVIASNLYFLLVLKIGLYGYLFSQMISFMGASLIMLSLIWGTVERESDSVAKQEVKSLETDMTGYGKGMLLYSTSSWVNNALDRYFVISMCGTAVNGLYAVAYKIPAILIVFQRIFAQAWQISANKNYDEADSAEYFAKVYKGYQTIMAVGCSGLIMLTHFVATILFAKDFFEAWVLVPPLLMSVIFGALTGFCGSICLAFKDGRAMGNATGVGALVNIILNFVGIRLIGATGAALATLISYFVMYMFAYSAVKKHVKLNINRFWDFLIYLLILVQCLVIIFKISCYMVVEIICFMLILLLYGRDFFKLLRNREIS